MEIKGQDLGSISPILLNVLKATAAHCIQLWALHFKKNVDLDEESKTREVLKSGFSMHKSLQNGRYLNGSDYYNI